MSDDELRAAIAISIGWNPEPVKLLPDWLHSLDACARDLLPVARERGWFPHYDANYGERDGLQEEWRFTELATGGTGIGHAPTGEIARALCLAWLAAMNHQPPAV